MFDKLFGKLSNSPELLLNDEAKLEKIAKKLCILHGLDPDAASELVISENGIPVIQPIWKYVYREVKNHLQILAVID